MPNSVDMDTETSENISGKLNAVEDLNSPATPPAHDTTGTEEAQPKTGLAQSLLKSATGAYNAVAAGFKKGRGRPRKDGLPGISDQIISEDEENPQPNLPAAHEAPANIIRVDFATRANTVLRRSVCNSLKVAISLCKQIIGIDAEAAGLDRDFTKASLEKCNPDPQAMDDWAESAELVMEKYEVKTEYAPEIALGVNTIKIFAPFALLRKELKAEIERKRKLEAQPKRDAA